MPWSNYEQSGMPTYHASIQSPGLTLDDQVLMTLPDYGSRTETERDAFFQDLIDYINADPRFVITSATKDKQFVSRTTPE